MYFESFVCMSVGKTLVNKVVLVGY